MKPHNKIATILHDETGAGFLESLIAIIIGGITCVALIGVAVTVIREAKNNEIRDAMTFYSIEGMELLRVIAANDFDQISFFDTTDNLYRGVCFKDILGTTTTYAYFDETAPSNAPHLLPDSSSGLPVDRITDEGQMCSRNDNPAAICEKLPLPSGGPKILYRELIFTPVGPVVGGRECHLIKVTVRVGMIANTSAGGAVGEYARNFQTEIELDGYITK